jgi:hypothetical protein
MVGHRGDKNPDNVPIEKLAHLKVLQTIKEGKAIFMVR